MPLRPMNLGDLLDGAVQLCVVNWRALLLTVAVVMVPLQLLVAWLQRGLFEVGFLDVFTNRAAFDAFASEAPFSVFGLAQILDGIRVTIAVSVLVLPVITGAVCRVVAGSYLGQPVPWNTALREAGRRGISLVCAANLIRLIQHSPLLLAVGAFAGGLVAESVELLLLAPVLLLVWLVGYYLWWARYAATLAAIMVEDVGPLSAMRRSWRLRNLRFWPTVGAVLVASVLAGIVGGMIGWLLSFGGALVGGTFAWVPVGVAVILTQLVELPLLAAFSTLLYFDGRIRREGLDLEIMGSELGA